MNKTWEVLLIGGSSGIGKSHLARQLSEHYKLPHLEVDDIRIALQQVVSPEQYPQLFTFVNNPNFYHDYDEHEFVTKLLEVGEVVWKALDALISKHVKMNEPVIIEGDGIIPKLLSQRNLDDVKIIILQDELEIIKARQLKRNRMGKSLEKAEKNSLFSHTYTLELVRQAEIHSFPTLRTSPEETLLTRAISLIDGE